MLIAASVSATQPGRLAQLSPTTLRLRTSTFDAPAPISRRPRSTASGAPSTVLFDPTDSAPVMGPDSRTTRGAGPARALVASSSVVTTAGAPSPPPVTVPSTAAKPITCATAGLG